MNPYRIKVQIDQEWITNYPRSAQQTHYRITAIRGHRVFARIMLHNGELASEESFGDIDQDGLPNWSCGTGKWDWYCSLSAEEIEKARALGEDRKKREAYADKWL